MLKRLPWIQVVLSVFYILLNFKKIGSAFRSDIWSKEIDLINHVTNYNVHLQVISIILIILIGILLIAYLKEIVLSNYLLGIIIIFTTILFLNTQVDVRRWIEINVFGGGGLLLLTILLMINLIWKMYKGQSESS